MVAIDGAGFDWSYMADDEVPTNIGLMAFSDSEVHNDKTCSKTCLKNFETLKTQLDDLRIEFNKSEFNLATYKRGLASVEEQLVFYKKNEVIFYEQLVVLKRDISYKDSKISVLKSEFENLSKKKKAIKLKIEKYDNCLKRGVFSSQLIRSQITDKSRKGVGFVSYNVIPPPPIEKFQQPEFKGYGPKTSKSVSEDISNKVSKSPDAPLVEELVSNDKSQGPRGNIKNTGINQKSISNRSDFGGLQYKACFICGSFDHVQANCNYHQRERMVSGNNYIRPNGKLIYNSILNGPYVRRMIPEPGDPARTVPVPETPFSLGSSEEPYMLMLIAEKTAQVICVTCSANVEKVLQWNLREERAKLFNEWEGSTSN
ncbi:hypothetical protein Tco_0462796 [Tanacetum coccineum]